MNTLIRSLRSDAQDILSSPDSDDDDLEFGERIMSGVLELERLRKMLTDHGINPDAEYIAPGGLRVDPPASKQEPTF